MRRQGVNERRLEREIAARQGIFREPKTDSGADRTRQPKPSG